MSPSSPASARRVLAATGVALLVAACGAPGASPTASPIPPAGSPAASGGTGSPSASPSTGPSPSAAAAPGLLLEVTSEGGFISPLATLSAPPQVVVDDDGHIYTPAATDGTTTPMVAAISVRDVGPAGAAKILGAIRAAGLDKGLSGGGVAADTGATVFTVVIDGQTIVSRLTRGGGGPGVPGLPGGATGGPGASGGVGSAAFDLLAQLIDPSVRWGAASAPAVPYDPVGYRVYEAPETAGAMPATTEAWPLSTTLADFGRPAVPDFGTNGLRSGVVTGADASALAPALASATADTAFTSGGTTYQLWVRPLFPDAVGG